MPNPPHPSRRRPAACSPLAHPHGDFAAGSSTKSAKNCLWPARPLKGSGWPETVPPSPPGPALTEAPDGILGCEAAQLPESVFLRLRGRIAERRGWYAEKFRAWQMAKPRGARAFSIPSWENRALYPGGRDDPEIADLEAMFPADLFMERFGGVPCAPVDPGVPGVRSARARAAAGSGQRIGSGAGDRPGVRGAYAVLALEQRGPDVAVIDEVYLRRRVAGDVIAACRERSWWPRVRGGVIDVAGRQHHAAPSQIEIWASLGGIRLRSHRVPLRSGIDRLRTFLRDPASGKARLTVAPECRNLIEEFGMYRYHEASDLEPISEIPIDRDNHAIKALIYWLFDRFGPDRTPTPPEHSLPDYVVMRAIE